MAIIQINISDVEDGAVDIKMDFNPPIDDSNANKPTPAQNIAAEIIMFLNSLQAGQ